MMPTAEKKFLNLMQDHLQYVFAAACLLAGVGIRVSLGNVVSADYVGFLKPWYEQIKEYGITEQVGNYNLLYQFVIFIFARTGAAPMLAYKLFSAVFDFLLSLTAGQIVRNAVDAEKGWKGILAFCAVWLSPLVFTNSAAWAQCDAIYSFWAILALYCLQRERYSVSFLLLCDPGSAEQYQYFKPIAMMMTVVALGLLAICFLRRSYSLNQRNLYYMALLMTYTCVLFLPSMHERYSFPYEILAMIVAVLLPRTIPLCIGLLCISMRTYGSFLFAVPINMTYLVYANLVIYGMYTAIIFKELCAEKRNAWGT